MVGVDKYGYLIIAIVLTAVGGFVGLLSGWLISKLFRRERAPLADILSGLLGFWVGLYVSFIGFSYHAEFNDGKLVSRHVGGLADYAFLIAPASAISAVIIVKASAYLWTLLLRKR
jgi:ABC-type Co2+ transport system permease subunit